VGVESPVVGQRNETTPTFAIDEEGEVAGLEQAGVGGEVGIGHVETGNGNAARTMLVRGRR
jgi:hypothetical protein